MRTAMPWLVMTKKPWRPWSANTGSAGLPSTKESCVSATLMTSDPFGRVSFSNETSAEREISVMPSVLKSSPRVRAWPDAAMMRLESLIETLPTSRPVVPKLAVKSTTGGAVAVTPPVPATLAPLIATSRCVALRIRPGTPTSEIWPALATSA